MSTDKKGTLCIMSSRLLCSIDVAGSSEARNHSKKTRCGFNDSGPSAFSDSLRADGHDAVVKKRRLLDHGSLHGVDGTAGPHCPVVVCNESSPLLLACEMGGQTTVGRGEAKDNVQEFHDNNISAKKLDGSHPDACSRHVSAHRFQPLLMHPSLLHSSPPLQQQGHVSIIKIGIQRMYGPHQDSSNTLGRTGTDVHHRAAGDWVDRVAGGESSDDSEMELDDLHDLPDLLPFC
jgi:hypothetical protein